LAQAHLAETAVGVDWTGRAAAEQARAVAWYEDDQLAARLLAPVTPSALAQVLSPEG
jgi:hypothetical protein